MKKYTHFLLAIILLLASVSYAQTWNNYTVNNGLLDNQVRCITGDNNGTVWIGTRTKGIQGFNGINFISFPGNGSLPMAGGSVVEITGLKYIDGKMYIGVKSSDILGGLYVYNFSTNSMVFVGTLEIIGGQDLKVFHKASSGTIYAGTGNGFYKRITDTQWQKIGSGWCQSIAEKSNGKIYYTTFDSLFVYDGVTKKGLKNGLFYSVAFDGNDVGYVSSSSDIIKFTDDFTFTPLSLGGYSKGMATDKQGKVWIAGAGGAAAFGLKSISGNTITSYTTANSPLLSSDMTSVYVAPDNKKYIGHYSSGLNTLLDNAVVLPVQVSPASVNMLVGQTKLFTAQYGVKPYKWWVVPQNLGIFDTSGSSASFTAKLSGSGFIYVTGSNGADTAKASVLIADTGVIIKLPPTALTVTKGKYPDKIDISFSPSGEFSHGFEDGIPSNWKTNPAPGELSSFVASDYIPFEGSKSIKFDVYSPGSAVTDWLITDKIHVTPEKPNLTFYLRTAFALGNNYSSYIKVSTTNSLPASFTTNVREFGPAYLSDSALKWRPVSIDLSQYINQDIYIAFKCQAEDIIIYFDKVELTGQPGLTSIGKAVKSYKLYRSLTPQGIQNNSNVIKNSLTTTFSDTGIEALKNYYYAVSAVYDSAHETAITPVNFGIAYAQQDSIVLNPPSANVPVVDGIINAAEYSDSYKSLLSKSGYWADFYLKQTSNKLFIAVDYKADSILEQGDNFLFAFDKNRNYSYEDSLEGYYAINKTYDSFEVAYYPYVSPFGFTLGLLNPAGVVGNVSAASGHVQYEMSIDLTVSKLNLPANRKIGAFISAYDLKNNITASWLERLLAGEYSTMGFGSITFPTATGIKNVKEIPTEFAISQNYPNPFNPSTVIKYAVPFESNVKISVYNVLGQNIKELVNKVQSAGNYDVNFNASGLTSGIYFYSITAKSTDGKRDFSSVRKMILVK